MLGGSYRIRDFLTIAHVHIYIYVLIHGTLEEGVLQVVGFQKVKGACTSLMEEYGSYPS